MSKIKEKPLLFSLVVILLAIALRSIRPGYALLGWDNYSSYLNPQLNIVRMFFDSWRSFRGLGVPSDSEVTDVFRQFLFLIFAHFISQDLLDQLYFLGSMIVGVIATYFFVARILKRGGNSSQLADLGGFVAGFFYLFNLNTLSVFYFPITPYISRFFAIPVLLLALDTVFYSKKISLKTTLLLLIGVFFSSPSYVIGTVFITLVMLLNLFVLFQKQILKAILVMILFFLLNAFWIFPFVNYTVQKSGIIRLAPTFVIANETQLNKPQSFFELKKQLILWPNFFETQVTSLQGDRGDFLHPLGDSIDSSWKYSIFAIFPILYLSGSVIVLMRFQKSWHLLWAPLVLFLFLFLSMKEFSWLGFLYRFLDAYVPYFGVIFRFGDTKFHPYIAFSGSVTSAIAVVFLASLFAKIKKHLALVGTTSLLVLIVTSTSLVFSVYFSGNLIGFYMYNKIPEAYRTITTRINADPDPVRVLHLPYDDEVYWRSYSWGYVGSSFLYYMLEKPLIEKTFEPASMENAYINEQIQRILHNSQSLSGSDLSARSQELYDLISMLGVRYIIFDETIQTAQPSRGMNLWANFNTEEGRTILTQLERDGLISKSYVGHVSMNDYLNHYDKVFPIDEELRAEIQNEEPQEIILFEVAEPAPITTFLPQATFLDPMLEQELLVSRSIDEDHTVLSDLNAVIYPFLRKDGILVNSPESLSLNLLDVKVGEYRMQMDALPESSTQLLKLFARRTEENLEVRAHIQYAPTVGAQDFLAPAAIISVPGKIVDESLDRIIPSGEIRSNWTLSGEYVTDLRILVNNVIMPIPSLTDEENEIGSIIIDGSNVDLQILQRNSLVDIDPSTFKLTENPNCYGDALEDYSSKQEGLNGEFRVTSVNGSTCFWRDLATELEENTSHIELDLHIDTSQKSLDDLYAKESGFSSKPILTRFVQSLPKPNLFEVCVKEYNVPDCFNSARLFSLKSGDSKVRIPLTKSIANIQDILVQFVLKNTQYQQQTVEIDKAALYTYKPIAQTQFTIASSQLFSEELVVSDSSLAITIPRAYGLNTYDFNSATDGLYISSDPCRSQNTYRTFRVYEGKWISYAENCQNRMFAQIPFDSSKMYLWSIDYNLASGQHPKMVLKDGFHRYVNEFASLYQGYPDIDAFHAFQDPELPWQQTFTPLHTLQTENTYTYIYPRPEYADSKPKEFALEQYTENEGMLLISGFSVAELPSSWERLKLVPTKGESTIAYAVPQKLRFDTLLPSLRKLSIEKGANTKGGALLKFNEGFDEQWGISHSLLGALWGQDISKQHARCDGYANCFILSETDVSEGTSLYLYYFPQSLSFLGWGITLLTMAGCLARTAMRHKKSATTSRGASDNQ